MPRTITVDAFCDLAEDLAVSDFAAAEAPGLEDLVGGWGRVAGVSVAVETDTFAASGRAAAMLAGLVVRPHDAAPILRTATLTATIDDGGRIRLDRVDLRPAPGDPSDAERRVAAFGLLTRAKERAEDGEVRLSEEDAEEILAALARA